MASDPEPPSPRDFDVELASGVLRARRWGSRELITGAGHIVPLAERDRFQRAVPHAEVVEIDANHLTVNTHPNLAPAVRSFLRATA